MVAAGIKGILNFAPVQLQVPASVALRHVDLTGELQTLAYYLPGGPPRPQDHG
jgi:redox-sensing transcriptional repressor